MGVLMAVHPMERADSHPPRMGERYKNITVQKDPGTDFCLAVATFEVTRKS